MKPQEKMLNNKAENPKRRTEDGKRTTEHPAAKAESTDARAINFRRLTRETRTNLKGTKKGKMGTTEK